ncbi:histidine phosphatase family protein [Frankia sp. QA3]|uniref:histidine phosphatase family protein n=1 Tax=Frankia sp. QA3 TaxID=710111 RepID=UPI000269BCA0|nr:histidine phosphatase family protein [Frankia sp. QA3]EIV91333.1 fructose-2,6-bisphosphatase [Frankia sp. QA3]
MVDLILVRHAVSVAPVPGGHDEFRRPLTERGREQAGALVAFLGDCGASIVLSSPYLRAIQTIEPTARALGLPVQRRDELREWRSGLAPRSDWQAHYERSWADPETGIGTGETLAELATRARNTVRDLVASGAPASTILAATHGTWIARALLAVGLPIDCAFWLSMPTPAIYRLNFAGVHLQRAAGPALQYERDASPCMTEVLLAVKRSWAVLP